MLASTNRMWIHVKVFPKRWRKLLLQFLITYSFIFIFCYFNNFKSNLRCIGFTTLAPSLYPRKIDEGSIFAMAYTILWLTYIVELIVPYSISIYLTELLFPNLLTMLITFIHLNSMPYLLFIQNMFMLWNRSTIYMNYIFMQINLSIVLNF